MAARLLLLSNSTQAGGKYLDIWKAGITNFLKESKVQKITFIPFAGISITWDDYTGRVQNALTDFTVEGIHKSSDMKRAIQEAEAIVIGGGNTFNLLKNLQENELVPLIQAKVSNGTPYVGWSAGSNVATPDIGTTNDMPIVWPATDKALNLVPFNINPHFHDWTPPNQQGESRGDRLKEAVLVKRRTVVALSEGTAILTEENPPRYHLLKAQRSKLSPGTQLQVKVWVSTDDEDKYKIIDIPLGEGDESVILNPYLE